MSHQAVNWAIEQRVGGPSAKATLWSIANYANEYWCSWPSQQRIADESEQSPDTVQRRIRDLEEQDLVRRVPLNFAGRRSVDFFILKPSSYFSASLDEIEPLFPRGYAVAASALATADCGSSPQPKTPINTAESAPQATANAAANAAATVRQPMNLGTKEDGGGGGARARSATPEISPEAHRLSAELAQLCGHDIKFLPPRWARDGARVVHAWLSAGYDPEMMRAEVGLIMARKRDGKPENITYFDKPLAREHAARSQGHFLPIIEVKSRSREIIDAKPVQTSTAWQQSRDNWRKAAAEFSAAADRLDRTAPSDGDSGGE